jgi:hypothetical protein
VYDDGGPSLIAALRAVRCAPVIRTAVVEPAPRASWWRRWREVVAWWRFWLETAEEPAARDE